MTDVDGVALPGVTITLASPALIGDTRTAVTGADGRYRFPATPLGSYSVEASLNGFISQALGGIRVSIGSRMAANFQMRLGVQETVTVMGEAPLIDVKGSSAVQTTMAADYFQGLPSARTNAGATDLLGMAPGATVGSSDRAGGVTGRGGSQFGGTKNGAQFSFDGVNVNSSEGGEVELQMDFDNVAEVNFGGIGAPAEVGGYNGLVMNLVTKSGSNELHGQGNIFFRLDSFTTQNSDDPEFRRDLDNEHQWHLDVGGPLAKDKLWGYGSFRRSVRKLRHRAFWRHERLCPPQSAPRQAHLAGVGDRSRDGPDLVGEGRRSRSGRCIHHPGSHAGAVRVVAHLHARLPEGVLRHDAG